jgi:hypothetical protein
VLTQMTKTFDGTNYVFTTGTLDATKLELDANNKVIVYLTDGTTVYQATLTAAPAVVTTTTGSTALTNTFTFTINLTAGALTSITYTYSATPAGATTPTVSTTATTLTTTAVTAVYLVKSVEWKSSSTGTYAALSTDSNAPTGLAGATNLKNYMFKVTFASALKSTTGLTFTASIDNLTTTTAATSLTNTSTGMTVTYGTDYAEITVTTDVNLKTDGNYKISVTAFSGTDANGNTVPLPLSAYFIPGGTTLSTYVVNGSTATGPAYVATNAAIENPAGKTTVVLTFSGNIQTTAPTTGYARLQRTTGTTADYTIAASAATVTVSGNQMTLVFSQALTAASTYKVTFVSGTLKDASGAIIPVAGPITFKTQ